MKLQKLRALTGFITVIVLIFGFLFLYGAIAYPLPETVAHQYVEAIATGDENTIFNLTPNSDELCRSLTLSMAQIHMSQFGSAELRNIGIRTTSWRDNYTSFLSLARHQIALVTFEYWKPGQSDWVSKEIGITVVQRGWRRVVCGYPG